MLKDAVMISDVLSLLGLIQQIDNRQICDCLITTSAFTLLNTNSDWIILVIWFSSCHFTLIFGGYKIVFSVVAKYFFSTIRPTSVQTLACFLWSASAGQGNYSARSWPKSSPFFLVHWCERFGAGRQTQIALWYDAFLHCVQWFTIWRSQISIKPLRGYECVVSLVIAALFKFVPLTLSPVATIATVWHKLYWFTIFPINGPFLLKKNKIKTFFKLILVHACEARRAPLSRKVSGSTTSLYPHHSCSYKMQTWNDTGQRGEKP